MAAPVTVVAENRSLRTGQFIPDGDQLSIGKQWEEWLEAIEREFRFFRIHDPLDKKDALIIYGGKEIARLEKSLADQENGEELNGYERLREKLCNYYAPKKNKHYSRYIFLKLRPLCGESTTAYATRLREKSHDCKFENEDDRILEHIIQTTENQSLEKKMINRRWTLTEMLNEVHQLEDTKLQVSDMKLNDQHVDKVQRRSKIHRRYLLREEETHRDSYKQKRPCRYCGQHHSFGRDNCPAYGKQCNQCFRRNHFAKVCRTARQQRNRRQANRTRDVNRAAEDDFSDTGSELSVDEYFIENTVNHIQSVRNIKVCGSDEKKTVTVMVNDIQMEVEPDSGAEVNVMDEIQYLDYLRKTQEKPELAESKTEIRTLQNTIDVLGEFMTTVRNQSRGIKSKFIVVNGQINSAPLLGKKTLTELGMLKINEEGSFKEPNDLKMRDENAGGNVIQTVRGSSTTTTHSSDEETACREAVRYKAAYRSSPSQHSYGWQRHRRTRTTRAWQKPSRRGLDQTSDQTSDQTRRHQLEETSQTRDEWTLIQRQGRSSRRWAAEHRDYPR